ncbi:MAG: DNA-directed RNA polymerase [Candidatus Methanogaster sp.]|uniref:DNA-directed RNA polymerase n=1 Tax=Candidatus Methanogaster sp. TaxID=3386292 RepID=A0AC61KZC5_9EURY|nr:MAG: DNA-directed RNA polymerase [ANME-2 cluster archaeon]
MYLKTRLVDTVRIDPEQLGMPVMVAVGRALRDKLEGQIDKKLGALVAILDVVDIGDGRILFGDGGVYYEATFDALMYKPIMQEVTEGVVVEVVEFGVFIGVGPLDGLIHVSQLTDDFVSYDGKNSRLVFKESGRAITEGDKLRARIVAVSLNERDPHESRIGLTMRQPTLGKLEWLEEIAKEDAAKDESDKEGKE